MEEKVIVTKSKLTAIGDNIRNQTNTTKQYTLDEMASMKLGGTDTSDATATSEDILLGKTAYVNGVKVEGSIEDYNGEQEGGSSVTPIEGVTNDDSILKIDGYNGSAINIVQTTGTKTIRVNAENANIGIFSKATVTAANGAILTVNDVSSENSISAENLEPQNIVKDIDILGVVGTFEGGITPSGTKTITTNGTHDVKNYANANVNVPVPSDYIKPSGNLVITSNGNYNVKEKESVSVNVPSSGITPSGTYQVTNNGEYDITQYAKVNVNVVSSGGSDTTQEDGLITRRQIEYSNDRVTLLSSYVFYHYDTIKKFSFKNVITVGNYCFGSCNALIEINLPKVETIYGYGLVSCTKLKNLNFPNLTYCSEKVFRNCLSVESAYIPKITYMGTGCFEYCNLLKAVIITQEEQICTLNKDGFKQCYHMLGIVDSTYNPNGDKDGYIYVPDSLVDSYKSATNWSTYADQIKPLSELPQEYKDLYNIA